MTSIEPRIEFGVNYICFIHSLAGINWRQNDTNRFTGFLSKDEMDILQTSRQELSFADGNGGALASVFFFLPSSCGLSTEEDFKRYFSKLSEAVGSGNWQPLEESYRNELKRIRDFMPNFLRGPDSRPGVEYAERVERIEKVFTRHITRYKSEVWPDEKIMLIRVAEKISSFWDAHSMIETWERLMRIPFDAPSYDILLVSAMQNGPSANSLAFDLNTFRADDSQQTLDYLRIFIPHEVGTHLFVRRLPDFNWDYVSYIAMENLCHFLNTKAFGFAPYFSRNDSFYHGGFFADFYEKMSDDDPITLFRLAEEKATEARLKPE